MWRKTLIAAAALLGMAGTGHADSNILFILDASNSMWGQVEGRAKIETAKDALSRLVSDLPSGTRVGLMVYGHRSESSCEDVELALPVGLTEPARIVSLLEGIRPKGKTPIAHSIQSSVSAFPDAAEGSKHVVLISDGIETCGGDPCAAAGELAAADIQPRVHVIGFDISEEDRAQLQCIADLGGGRYFSADSTAGFADAVVEVVQVAQETESAPPPPASTATVPSEFFFDDFDGDRLSEDWVVHNPEPNAHLVDNGTLLLLSKIVGGFDTPDTANIIELARDLPDGDWDAHVTLTAELKSGRDAVWFGLRQDEQNYLSGLLWSQLGGSYSEFCLSLVQQSGDRTTREDTNLLSDRRRDCSGSGSSAFREEVVATTGELEQTPITLTFSKRGRSYHASTRVRGKEHQTDSLTSLRSPGRLTVAIGKWERADGELLVLIDSVRIETVE